MDYTRRIFASLLGASMTLNREGTAPTNDLIGHTWPVGSDLIPIFRRASLQWSTVDNFAAGLPFAPARTTAAVGTMLAKLRETVSVVDFGAKCDRVTDDTAAVQAAITYCAQSGRWRDLRVPGGCRITAPLIVDRLVDTMVGEFRIIGDGDEGGFYVDTAVTIFDSTFTVTTDPKSEHIGFYNIQFEASDPSMLSFVVSRKFLRVAFNNCYFQRIKAYASPIYVQSVRFRNCRARGWSGTFASSVRGFDVVFDNNAFEAGGALCDLSAVSGLRLINNLFEGSLGPFFRVDHANGVFVAGNYTEGNANPDYVFTNVQTGGVSRGVVLAGNFMALTASNAANPAFWNVVVGDCRGLASAGNYCNGQMFDDSATARGNLTSAGDWADVALNRSRFPIGAGGYAVVEASAVYAPGMLNAGTQGAIQTIRVAGALPGDLVESSFSADLVGVDLKAWVSGSDTVKFAFTNLTSKAVNFGSGTIKLRVRR